MIPRGRRAARLAIARRAVILAIGIAGSTATAYAQYPSGYTERDFMPGFCSYTQDGPQATSRAERDKRELYYAKLGEGFKHAHHYCRGLFRMHEAIQEPEKRQDHFDSAVTEINYVLARTGQEFPLRPRMLVDLGVALRSTGRTLEAADAYRRAFTIRPDYDAAYVALALLFESSGSPTEALSVLRMGEARGRNPEEFRRRILELETRTGVRATRAP